MKRAHARRSERRGFTLVELLIVIAIISVLISLISAAVWKAFVASNRVRNHNEINQLALAVENFKQKFGIYPPSRIVLCEQFDFYFVNNNRNSGKPKSPLHADSVAFLQQIWPRINFDFHHEVAPKWNGIDWNGDGLPTPGEYLLEGNQCLVFFLGGIPGKGSNGIPFNSGFSINPQNPAYHTSALGSEVIPPFFEFSSDRLTKLPQTSQYPFYSYLDTYRVAPYAYFSSYKTRNGYNRFASSTGSSDCASLFVWPYAESLSTPQRYLNPNTFQIISAGADGKFGRGSDPKDGNMSGWAPAIAGNTGATSVHFNYVKSPLRPDTTGLDDQSNFYDAPLGTPTTGN